MRKLLLFAVILFLFNPIYSQTTNPAPPANPVKLVFIHASIGRAWLCNGTNYGHLGGALGANNYYISDLDKDFDVPQNTDIFNNGNPVGGIFAGAIYNWFFDATVQGNGQTKSQNILNAIYTADHAYSVDPVYMTYKRDYITNPGGENKVIVFKPTHVSSSVQNSNSTVWTDLIGKHPSDGAHNIANNKAIYNKLVDYFKLHSDKMFVLVTPPPYAPSSTENATCTNTDFAANARTLNNWLVNNWLQDLNWANKNVYVFDFFNVVTGPNNHHRVVGTSPNYSIEHVVGASSSNFGYAGYYVNPGDSHPGPGGTGGSAGVKCTEEFVPLLNAYYNRYIEWVNGTTSLKNNELNYRRIIVYPTVFDNHIYIENSKEVTIYNILGSIVYKNQNTNEKQLVDLSNLTKGLYFVKASEQVIKILKK